METSNSPAFTLNSTDWKKGFRGAAITLGAAVLATLLGELLQMVQTGQIDFGPYQALMPLAVSVLGFALEMVRRYRTDHSIR